VLEQKILRVNLSEKSIREEYVPTKITERYIGGKGLAAYYLYEELEPETSRSGILISWPCVLFRHPIPPYLFEYAQLH